MIDKQAYHIPDGFDKVKVNLYSEGKFFVANILRSFFLLNFTEKFNY